MRSAEKIILSFCSRTQNEKSPADSSDERRKKISENQRGQRKKIFLSFCRRTQNEKSPAESADDRRTNKSAKISEISGKNLVQIPQMIAEQINQRKSARSAGKIFLSFFRRTQNEKSPAESADDTRTKKSARSAGKNNLEIP
ncbi:MAG TPA: hypothetical protein PLY70_02165 [Saprospiraceae bacterium]|nr:hypothetical protein [Saprospiraceae bacterium]HPN68046.1 hypothetical protein [Saprospiraceae bacterium]